MKAYEIGPQNDLESLRLRERRDLEPKEGELLLRVKAACLNHRDLLVLKGHYGALKPETRIPLSDGVGEIIALGKGVRDFSKGQRIIAPHFTTWREGPFGMSFFAHDLGISADGWLAEKIIIPACSAIAVPQSISDEAAAGLAVAGTTVWHCLVDFGGLKLGDWVLTLGTGGVSIFTLQIAKALGARTAITSSSDTKLAIAQKMGADAIINYRTSDDWAAELREKTSGHGADIIVETAGFATLEHSIAAAAVNGRIAIIGALAGAPGRNTPDFSGIIAKNLTFKGITSGSRAMMLAMLDLLERCAIVPLIEREFAFHEASKAYERLASGEHIGKILIRIAEDSTSA